MKLVEVQNRRRLHKRTERVERMERMERIMTKELCLDNDGEEISSSTLISTKRMTLDIAERRAKEDMALRQWQQKKSVPLFLKPPHILSMK